MKPSLRVLLGRLGSRNAATRLGHAFADGFAARHPGLLPWLALVQRVRDVDVIPRGNHSAEATAHGYAIDLSSKFYELPPDVRDVVFAHEIGHVVEWHYSRDFTLRFIRAAEALGIDPWDTPNLPYGQFRMDEAFADVFAEVHVGDGEVHRRYPAWVKLVEAIQADRDPPGMRRT